MAVFAYKGRSGGSAVAGEIEADSRPAAVAALRAKGVTATAVAERKAKAAAAATKLGGKVKDKDMAIYTRQFSTMVDAGLPIAQCLQILSEQSDSKVLRDVTTRIANDVQGGATLAESFGKYPKTFDNLFVNMLAVGESGGVLDVVLQRLSGYIEKAAKLKGKVKSAMVYPVTIISVAVLVIIFMMVFVLPTFASMFKNMGAELPLPTKIVMWMSDMTRKYILVMVAIFIAGVYALKRYYQTDTGSMAIDAFALKVPVIGMLIRKVAVARFTRTLATLISSGVPILEGLLITARSAGNRVVEKAVMHARQTVTAGGTLAEPLKSSPVFPPMVVHMISVGENVGALDAMLSKIADFYDDEVDAAVTALTSLLEPMMICFLGVAVGGIVVAMYLPIFKMVTLIK
ncbi:MAG: type II secretion system F family protein [Candidatus Rokuibacteriota bacterium]